VLSYIQPVFAAFQRASALSMFSFAVSILFLVFLVLAPATQENGLFHVGVLYLAAMLVAHFCLIILFFVQHPQARFRFAEIDHRLRSNIVGFGMRLFVIQIAAMVIFTLSRLLVSLFFGAAAVVVYDGGFRIFSVVSMVHTLVMSTLWSSFTHAYEQADWAWIRRTMVRLRMLMVPLMLGCAVLAALAPWLVAHWLGRQQVGAPGLYAWFAAITILGCWSNIFAYFLNGIGDVSVQFYSAIAAALINVPASYFFAVTLSMGISGILAGTFVSLSVFSLLGPWQVARILARK
jgi:O-antigen/teichoic acid export membrane protein